MILVDTSVWVAHFRRGNPRLVSLLHGNQVLTHPFIVGELACGALRERARILRYLKALPEARLGAHEEVLQLVENEELYRRGIGWIDAHLLASARLSGCGLWTLDRKLSLAASLLNLSL
jgi:hypothetical protein